MTAPAGLPAAPRGWSRYLTPPPATRALGALCLGVGAQEGPVPWVRGRTLGEHALVVVDAGDGVLEVAGRRHPVPAGSAFWLRPGEQHAYGPGPGGWSERWVLLTGTALAVHDRALPADARVLALRDPDAVRRLLARLRASLDEAPPLADVERAGLLHALVAEVGAGRPAGAEDPVLQGLRDRAVEPATIAQHARQLGVSVDALRAAVRAATGLSPKAFVVAERLARAQQLLAETDLTVAAVARRVGIDDAAYFTRAFGRHVGLSPSAFRERHLRTG